jgi:hypothetical protein
MENAVGRSGFIQQISNVSTLVEIESALKRLPLQEAQEVAQWLEDYIGEQVSAGANQTPLAVGGGLDYGARRRRIFGEKVLPNMVMASRGEECW